jgi:hypothetical protein
MLYGNLVFLWPFWYVFPILVYCSEKKLATLVEKLVVRHRPLVLVTLEPKYFCESSQTSAARTGLLRMTFYRSREL